MRLCDLWGGGLVLLRVGLALLDFTRKFAGDKEKVCPVERVQRMRKQDGLSPLQGLSLYQPRVLQQTQVSVNRRKLQPQPRTAKLTG